MRATICLLLLLATVGYAGVNPTRQPLGEASSPDANVKWAERIIMEFFEALKNEDGASVGFLTAELARAYPNWEKNIGPFERYTFPPSQLRREVAPNGSEVIYSGRLKGRKWEVTFGDKHEEGIYSDGEFVLYIAREASGRWSIRYIRVRELTAKPQKQ